MPKGPYTPHDWYWIVGDDASRAWSSRIGGYVADYPSDKFSHAPSEDDLSEILRPYGLVPPKASQSDFAAAIQRHVDATAQTRGYADGVAIAGYSTSTVPSWAAEAAAFIAWRDQVWIYAYTELAKVQGGQRAQPTIVGLINELPTIVWPGA